MNVFKIWCLVFGHNFGDLWEPSGTSGDHLGLLGAIGGPLGATWGPLGTWGPSGDHLGNRFDEVIGSITDADHPECADQSVSSSEYRWSEN